MTPERLGLLRHLSQQCRRSTLSSFHQSRISFDSLPQVSIRECTYHLLFHATCPAGPPTRDIPCPNEALEPLIHPSIVDPFSESAHPLSRIIRISSGRALSPVRSKQTRRSNLTLDPGFLSPSHTCHRLLLFSPRVLEFDSASTSYTLPWACRFTLIGSPDTIRSHRDTPEPGSYAGSFHRVAPENLWI